MPLVQLHNVDITCTAVMRMYKTTTEAEDDVTSVVTDSTMSVQDQRHLQEKLHELQMKKQHMDQLLDELQALKIEREIHNNGE